MKRIVILFLSALSVITPLISTAQKPNYSATLFTIGDEGVTLGKFDSVYRKNNTGKELDYSAKAINDYLTLYVNFRLKVKEARNLKMDTMTSVQSELTQYRNQLAKNYMQDKEVEDKLLQEAYNRSKTDVHVEHILIKLDANASPADTLKAFDTITAIRARILKGADFNIVALQASKDPSVKDNKGDLGWITALQVIYSFENAAYNTPVGQVSQVFRTQYGYHIIKVLGTRPDRGQLVVEHIFKRVPKAANDIQSAKAKEMIDSVYHLLNAGANWVEMVKRFSDDKSTVNDSGKLPLFGAGKMVAEFEDAAFALKNPGDISQPVRSPYGWHIIRLVQKKPLGSFDDMKDALKKQVDHDQRSTVAQNAFVNDIKKEYNFKEYAAAKVSLGSKMDTSLKKAAWKASSIGNMNDVLFSLMASNNAGKGNDAPATKSYTQADFASYIEANERKYAYLPNSAAIYDKLYEQYVNSSLMSFEQGRLEYKYPAFRDLMHEYEDGILLFELTDKMVWSKAVKDSNGLAAYYEANKTKYMSNPKVKAAFYFCANASIAANVSNLLNANTNDNDIMDKVNTKDAPGNVKLESNAYEKGQNSTLDSIGWKVGTYTINKKNGSVEIVKITALLPAAPKTLEEAKGYVVADYQEYLENQWIDSLRQKYPVKINQDVLNTIVKRN
jgi:peptidyl-prolyl cis-trans isomerase SurA